MNVYDIAIEVAKEEYLGENGIVNVLMYIGVDDAVGFIVNSEFGEDYDYLRECYGEEKANALIDHYEKHCK